MRLPIFVVLLVAGLIGSALALRLATRTSDRQGVMFATGLAGGTAAVWGLVTIASFNIVSYSGGSTLTDSYPSLATLGVVGVGVSLLILFKGSAELLQ